MNDTGVICRKSQLIAYPTKIIYDGDNIKDEDFVYYLLSANPKYAYKFENKKVARSTVITFGENVVSDRPYGVSNDDENIETSKYPRIDIDYDDNFKCNFKSLYLNPLATYRVSGLTTRTSDTAYVVIGECYPETDTLINVDSDGKLVYGTPTTYPYKYHLVPPYYFNRVEVISDSKSMKLVDPQIVYGKDTCSFKGAINEIKVGNGVEKLFIFGCNSLNKIDMCNSYKLSQIDIENCINIENIIVPDGVTTVYLQDLFSLKSLQLPDTIRNITIGSYVKLIVDSIWDGNTVQDNGVKIDNVCYHIGNVLESQSDMLSSSKIIFNKEVTYPDNLNLEYLNTHNTLLLSSIWTTRFISSCNFDNAIYIGSNVFKTDQYAIAQGENICHANFGNNTEEVEFADYAFANSGLKTIVLPKFKKKFGKNVLGGTYVETLIIPDTWDNIDAYSFKATSSLANVTIPKTIKNIGAEAFAGTRLTAVTIAKDCKYVKSAFPSGCTINYYDD